MELKRVVVTGLGALTPIGNTKDDKKQDDPDFFNNNDAEVLIQNGEWSGLLTQVFLRQESENCNTHNKTRGLALWR